MNGSVFVKTTKTAHQMLIREHTEIDRLKQMFTHKRPNPMISSPENVTTSGDD